VVVLGNVWALVAIVGDAVAVAIAAVGGPAKSEEPAADGAADGADQTGAAADRDGEALEEVNARPDVDLGRVGGPLQRIAPASVELGDEREAARQCVERGGGAVDHLVSDVGVEQRRRFAEDEAGIGGRLELAEAE